MNYANFVETQLDAPLLADGTSALLRPADAPYQLPPEDGGVLVLADSMGKPSTLEIIKYASRDGLTLLGLERGLEGTTPTTWPGRSYCYQPLTAGGFESIKQIIDEHVAVPNPHPQYLGAESAVSLYGPTEIYITQSVQFEITDYDSFSEYLVQVTAGTASIEGSTISFGAPEGPGDVTLTLFSKTHRRDIHLDILPAQVAAPTITFPSDGETGVIETPTFTTGPFQTIGIPDTHLDTDWELWTGPGRTGTLAWSSLASAVDKLDITLPRGVQSEGTDYCLAVRHRGAILGAGEWAEISYTTADSFNSYIPIPNPTPDNFGDPFEGGFYMGLFWNQIAQSSSSKTLATGSQSFVVPDMTSAPIVYEGHELEIRSRANPNNKFIGTVTAAAGVTLTLDVTSVGGSGTFDDWSVMSKFRNIGAPKSSGEHAGIALKDANTALPDECQTLTEGWESTLAMAAAGSATEYPAAHWARSLVIGGKDDWHIPARDVLEQWWRNGKPVTDSNYVVANRPAAAGFDYKRDGSYGDAAATHGTNNNSYPVGAAYTAANPARTNAAAFRSGGAEAFEFGSAYYWSSSEYSATLAWRQHWSSSSPGNQGSSSKAGLRRLRAVRRSII